MCRGVLPCANLLLFGAHNHAISDLNLAGQGVLGRNPDRFLRLSDHINDQRYGSYCSDRKEYPTGFPALSSIQFVGQD